MTRSRASGRGPDALRDRLAVRVGRGRLLIAPGGGARNKDTPDPPPSTNKLALGGSDPLPTTNELALGGSDPPPSTNELVRGGVVLTLPA